MYSIVKWTLESATYDIVLCHLGQTVDGEKKMQVKNFFKPSFLNKAKKTWVRMCEFQALWKEVQIKI